MYRYIESEKGQAKTHRAREVRDRASPDRSRETDETSGIDLTQRSEGRKALGRDDARKRRGRVCVGSGMR